MVAGEVHYYRNPALIFITDGQSVWNIHGEKIQVSSGQLIAAEKDTVIKIMEGGTADLTGWEIHFHTYKPFSSEEGGADVDWKVPDGHTFQQVQLTGHALAGLGHYFRDNGTQNFIPIRLSNQSLVYELLKHLYRNQPDSGQTTGEGLLRSITYMQEHYGEIITRNQLARITGVSPWHYSRKFSERYGISPLSYLAQYRVYRAQEQLLLTRSTSQAISGQVGFEDVHYFSRRFKQFTGVSPRNYAQTLNQRKIVALAPLLAETMIGLGVIPHAVVSSPVLLAEHQLELFTAHGVEILETDQFNLDVERISQVQPELILGPFITEDKKQKLRTIAPVITDLQLDLEDLLIPLGTLLHKEKAAAGISRALAARVNEARNQLNPVIQSAATVMVLRIEPFGYRYLGGRSNRISRLLYDHLGLGLPEPLKAGEAWFNPCSAELLSLADPDYLFVERRVMEHFDAEDSSRKLMESSQWKNLKAARNQQVFYIDTRLWVDGCGTSGYPVILDQIVSFLSGSEAVCAQ
ncbi:hypothetical protein C2I18_24845 [Paenibacillus sp. PK3_47]|nr:hypothetical protein C2I18_24845 [Paenibacillus sp. PK3_47]